MATASSLSSLVARWRGRWRFVGAHQSDDAAALQLEMIRMLADPQTPREVYEGLIEAGQFASAEGLLNESVQLGLDDLVAMRDECAANLERARNRALERIDARRGAASIRAGRLGAALEIPSFSSIAAECRQSRPAAEATIQAFEKRLSELESRTHADLAQRLEQAIGSAEMQPWHQQVTTYLNAGELELARWSLHAGPDRFVPRPSRPPRMSRWPYGDYAVAEVCDWFLGNGRPVSGFSSRVDISTLDANDKRVVSAMKQLWQAGTDATIPATVAEFAQAFASLIEAIQRNVECRRIGPGTYITLLQGLRSIELPGLPDSLPLVIRLLEDECVLPEPQDGICLALGRMPQQWPASYIEIRPALIFSLVSHSHRRLNFLRSIGGRFPLGAVLPPESSRHYNGVCPGRRGDLERLVNDTSISFVTGQRGVGVSGLLKSVRLRLLPEQRARGLVELTGPPACCGVDELIRLIDKATVTGEANETLIVDGSRALSPLMDQSGGTALVAACDLFVAQRGHRIIISIPASWQRVLADAGASERVLALDPLATDEIRAIASGLVDVLGIPPVKPELVDRITFYASGRLGLTYHFMRAVLLVLDSRADRSRSPVDAETIETAWRSDTFLDPAKQLLFEPLHAGPASLDLLLSLANVLCGDGGRSVTRHELADWWTMYVQQPADSSLFTASLDALVAEGLLLALPSGDYDVPYTGVGLLIRHVQDASEAAIASLAKRVMAAPNLI